MKVPIFDGRRGSHRRREAIPGQPIEWSDDEINFIQKWVPVFGYGPVATAMGVHPKWVRDMAIRMEVDLPEPDLSFRLIASALGISEGSARKCYASGMRKLSDLLKECR